MIKCLLTELGRAGRENIWLSVRTHGPRCARSVRPDLEPNIFPSCPPTQSISTYYAAYVLRILQGPKGLSDSGGPLGQKSWAPRFWALQYIFLELQALKHNNIRTSNRKTLPGSIETMLGHWGTGHSLWDLAETLRFI